MKILGDIQWFIAIGVVLVFGMFPICLQILRIRLCLKRGYLTEEGEVASTLIPRLYLYLFFAAVFQVLMVIGYSRGDKFETIFWLFVITMTVFLLNRSMRTVDPVMTYLTEQKKFEYEYKDSIFEKSERKYDIFISYKTKDSDFVRQIAEQIMGSDIKVWFFEYKILLEHWKEFKPKNWEGFELELSKIIRNSEFGLAFTNDRYANSYWCKFEMTQLLASGGPGPQRVIEIRTPGQVENLHREFPTLRNSPSHTLDDRNDVLTFVSEITKQQIHTINTEPPNRIPHIFEGRCLGKTYQLDASEWQIVKSGGASVSLQSVEGPHFRRNIEKNIIEMNLYYGRELSREAIRKSEDDRQMYDQLMEYASRHLDSLRTKLNASPILHGVHLVHVGGYAQMALTYWMSGYGYWTRKYSAILYHSESGDAVEFVFTFGFLGSSGSFQRFCRYGYIMDNLVKSLKWPIQR